MSQAQSSSWQLDLDAVAHFPRPGTTAPTQFAFSPDSRLLTFLWSERGDLVRDLWALDLHTGQRRALARAAEAPQVGGGALPLEEVLRRERQRIREAGITRYQWAKGADRLLLPIAGQLYMTSGAGGALVAIASSDHPTVDPQLSADGRRAVFARDRELWMAEIDSGTVRRLTFDAMETVCNGVAEFVAQEEMGRSSGFWPSPDGSRVAYAQVDEGPVPPYPIVHQGSESWQIEHHRYPFAGERNVRVRLGVVSLEGGATQWLDLGPDEDLYLARVDWHGDDLLLVQVESRDQRRLELRAYDLPRGVSGFGFRVVLVEESDPWINLHHDLRCLADGSFLWASERTGFKHLYLYGADGSLIRALTHGEWPVDSVVHVDEARRLVYFAGGRETPLERHLYRVPLDGGELVRLSQEPGFHSAVFAPSGECYVHVFESLTQPPCVTVRSADGGALREVHAPGDGASIAPGLQPPELVEVPAEDGTPLYGAIYYPEGSGVRGQGSGIRGQGSVRGQQSAVSTPHSALRTPPLVVSVYGGPHAQMVTNSWGMTVDLRAQYLASRGFVVFKLDNRGSARRGLAFEGAIARQLGKVELLDQRTGVQWLAARGIIDGDRVGIYGWSYGGYMAAMGALRAPDVFKVGVAGAPVVDWTGYDTHYTERYLGTPLQNPEGYRASSVLSYVGGPPPSPPEGVGEEGSKLLLIHGMVDENVHFRHTARLIAALEDAERPFELLVFPEERHGFHGPDPQHRGRRRYLEARIAGYFLQNL